MFAGWIRCECEIHSCVWVFVFRAAPHATILKSYGLVKGMKDALFQLGLDPVVKYASDDNANNDEL